MKTFSIAEDAVVDAQTIVNTSASVLPRLRIGAGARIGAGSVVTRDVPPDAIVVGVPAPALKKRLDQDRG